MFLYMMGFLVTLLMLGNYNCTNKTCNPNGLKFDEPCAWLIGTLIFVFWWATPTIVISSLIYSWIVKHVRSYNELHSTVNFLQQQQRRNF